jgi:Flp pilus assembly protein TadG
LLFSLVFGLIWFGLVFHRWITVTHAAREGVRAFALSGDPADGASAGNSALAGLAGADCDDASPAGPVGSGTEVSVTCRAPYPPPLFIFSHSGTLSSTAVMRRE